MVQVRNRFHLPAFHPLPPDAHHWNAVACLQPCKKRLVIHTILESHISGVEDST